MTEPMTWSGTDPELDNRLLTAWVGETPMVAEQQGLGRVCPRGGSNMFFVKSASGSLNRTWSSDSNAAP